MREGGMVRKKFICTQCGHKFEADIVEREEAEEKRISTRPIRCPKCNGRVERI